MVADFNIPGAKGALPHTSHTSLSCARSQSQGQFEIKDNARKKIKNIYICIYTYEILHNARVHVHGVATVKTPSTIFYDTVSGSVFTRRFTLKGK